MAKSYIYRNSILSAPLGGDAVVSVYESIVKEYLELCGNCLVRLDMKFKKDKGWSDIDILAICFDDEHKKPIVGEVKAFELGISEVKDINDNHFNHPSFKEKLESVGIHDYQKYIFCWDVDDDVREYARKNDIKIKCYREIVAELYTKEIKPMREKGHWFYHEQYPFTTLLQLIFENINYINKQL